MGTENLFWLLTMILATQSCLSIQMGSFRSVGGPMVFAHAKSLSTDKTYNTVLYYLEGSEMLERTIIFPVDSYLRSLDIHIIQELQLPNVSFPVGIVYDNVTNDDSIRTYHFSNVTSTDLWSFSVNSSIPGWSVVVEAESVFDVTHGLYSQTPQGFKKIQGKPIRGSDMRVYLTPRIAVGSQISSDMLDGIFKHLVLRNLKSMEVLFRYNLTKFTLNSGYVCHTDDFVVPTYDFSLDLEGVDSDGFQLQRHLGEVKTSFLSIVDVSGELVTDPDYYTNITVSITNHGPDNDFNITATTLPKVSVSVITPSSFRLAAGASINATIRVSLINCDLKDETTVYIMVVSSTTQRDGITLAIPIMLQKASPPKCTILSSSFAEKCNAVPYESESCGDNTWSAEMSVFQRDTGYIETDLKLKGKGLNSSNSVISVTDGNTTLLMNVTGSCCADTVTFKVTNWNCLSDECVLRRDPTTSTQSPIMTTTSSSPSSALSFGAIAGIAVAVVAGMLFPRN